MADGKADGKITIDTKINNDGAKKDLSDLTKEAEKTGKRIDQELSESAKETNAEYAKLAKQQDEVNQKIEKQRALVAKLRNEQQKTTGPKDANAPKLDITSEIDKQKAIMDDLVLTSDALTLRMDMVNHKASKLTEQFRKANEQAKQTKENIENINFKQFDDTAAKGNLLELFESIENVDIVDDSTLNEVEKIATGYNKIASIQEEIVLKTKKEDEALKELIYQQERLRTVWGNKTALKRADDMQPEIDTARVNVEKLNAKFDESVNKMEKLEIASRKLADKINQSANSAHNLSSEMDNTKTATKQVNNEMGKSPKVVEKTKASVKRIAPEVKKVSKEAKEANRSLDFTPNINMGLRKIAKIGLALFSIRTVYSMLSKASNAWLNSDNVVAKQLRANIDYLWRALGSVLAPVIEFITNLVYKLMTLLNGLLGTFFGINMFANATADSTKDTAGNLASGAKSAKEIKKQLAGFDEMNILNFNKDSDSGGGATPPKFDMANFDSLFAKFDDLMLKAREVADIFMKGFNIGFGDSAKDIERIKGYLVSIKDSMIEIFTDPRVVNSASNWAESFIFNLGKVTGSIASIGVTCVTLLVGSIATYLERNKEFIKDKLVALFDIGTRINDIIGTFATVLAEIFRVFASDRAISIGSNLIQTIVNGALNAMHLFLLVGEAILKKITDPIIENKDKIKDAIYEALGPIEEVTGHIAESMTDFPTFIDLFGKFAGVATAVGTAFLLIKNAGSIMAFATGIGQIGATISSGGLLVALKALGSTLFPGLATALGAVFSPIGLVVGAIALLAGGFVYLYTSSEDFRNKINDIFSSMFSHIGGVIGGIINIIKTLWTKGFGPIISSIMDGLSILWDNGLSELIENISVFVLSFIDAILSFWDNAMMPLINLLLQVFLPIITTVFDAVMAVVVPVLVKIMEYVNKAIKVFNLIIDVLKDTVFPIFKTIFEGLGEVVEAFWDFAGPIFDWFIELLGAVVTFALDFFLAPLDLVFGTLVEIIENIIDPIKDIFKGVEKIFKGIIDFVVGIFTGDWERAWEGVKGIFEGIWNTLSGIVDVVWKTITGLFSKGGEIFSGVVDGIADAFKTIVNCIIHGLNQVIAFPFNKINDILNGIRGFDIPLIGKPFKGLWKNNPLPVPQIPKLAKGTIVNRPMHAIIGESGKEAVMPLQNHTEWMYDLADIVNAGRNDTSDTEIILNIDGEAFMKWLVKKQKQMQFAMNGGMF